MSVLTAHQFTPVDPNPPDPLSVTLISDSSTRTTYIGHKVGWHIWNNRVFSGMVYSGSNDLMAAINSPRYPESMTPT